MRPTRSDVAAVVAAFDKNTGFRTPPAAVASETGSPMASSAGRATLKGKFSPSAPEPSQSPCNKASGKDKGRGGTAKAAADPKAVADPKAKRGRKRKQAD